ncbi:tetraspanin-1 isoform X2 [Microcaecilia unicolor]|uniref:Tetraspanin n=1 Tax=Microcaecilia unicolor TaxID=1415580 RepID=A0A6P7XLD4_9AMPH|nr:tetraspanin-1-like isoform X2 [Microcaecilia unicolor]
MWSHEPRASSTLSSTESWLRLRNFYTCLKYMMFCFNTIIFVSGGILLGLGIWIRYGGILFSKILGSYAVHFLNIGYFCIVVGLMLTVLGFLGCLGAMKESRFLLLMFIMTMMAIFIAKIAAAVLALAFTQMLKCCGFNNYTDFSNSVFVNKTGLLYPKACCTTPDSSVCDGRNINSTVIFMKGCFVSMRETLQNHSLVIGGATAAATALELASILVAMVLFIKVN